jgi:TPR repeat protein
MVVLPLAIVVAACYTFARTPLSSSVKVGASTTAVECGAASVYAANRGDARAQYNLGLCALTGGDVTAETVAIQWLSHSARQRNAPAEFQLGVLYSGLGDRALAVVWLSRAALNGHVQGQHHLGLALRDTDPVEALKWFELAAKQGDSQSAFLAGSLHGKTFKDMKMAVQWFEVAANAGHPKAAGNLGTQPCS